VTDLDTLPVLPFADETAWEAWLAEHHAEHPDGIWIRVAKKGAGIPTVTYGEALDVALCFGWIDGQSKGIDETWYRQRWLPRRRRSVWSKRNRAKAEALIAAGRMRPPGLAEVERAKADGRWEAAYDSPANATVPGDLRAALDARPAAAEAFAGLDGQNRYAILHRLQLAKRETTRAKRIEQFVDMLERGERLHP
jgi:uncharacterized protein YdeI (YjbR/CyaY-like superfamily)